MSLSKRKTPRTVTREKLYDAVYKKIGCSRTEARALVELFFNEIIDCLERGETVKLNSFGSFIIRQRGKRVGRNPKTGDEASISARRVVVFKPSVVFKKRIKSTPDKAPQAAPTGPPSPFSGAIEQQC
jgi:integration host factor subunit alpha